MRPGPRGCLHSDATTTVVALIVRCHDCVPPTTAVHGSFLDAIADFRLEGRGGPEDKAMGCDEREHGAVSAERRWLRGVCQAPRGRPLIGVDSGVDMSWCPCLEGRPERVQMAQGDLDRAAHRSRIAFGR